MLVKPVQNISVKLVGKYAPLLLLCRHRIRKYSDSPVHTLSDSLKIFFHSEERNLSDSGARKPYPEKKCGLKKYPDTCGWGLNR